VPSAWRSHSGGGKGNVKTSFEPITSAIRTNRDWEVGSSWSRKLGRRFKKKDRLTEKGEGICRGKNERPGGVARAYLTRY